AATAEASAAPTQQVSGMQLEKQQPADAPPEPWRVPWLPLALLACVAVGALRQSLGRAAA
ncbi:MAG: hypothetical protein IT477_08300, partial [Rhodanobacteraceae bacterium]|nr:hypothetical protein [Rhodanobacteraceae bacterium]